MVLKRKRRAKDGLDTRPGGDYNLIVMLPSYFVGSHY